MTKVCTTNTFPGLITVIQFDLQFISVMRHTGSLSASIKKEREKSRECHNHKPHNDHFVLLHLNEE